MICTLRASRAIARQVGQTNPYRFDGRDGVQSDSATGLDWMSTRAYDPSTGRFISQDPLRRTPLFFADNPYVYAGNNPLSNVDPSGQRVAGASSSQAQQAAKKAAAPARVQTKAGKGPSCDITCKAHKVQSDAIAAENAFATALGDLGALAALGAGSAYSVATLAKLTLEEVSKTLVFGVIGGAFAGVAAELAMGYFIFKSEAAQSLSWFKQKGNIDTFFLWTPGLVIAISAVAGLTTAGLSEDPVFAAFAVGILLGAEGVVSELRVAQHEQDHEYA